MTDCTLNLLGHGIWEGRPGLSQSQGNKAAVQFTDFIARASGSASSLMGQRLQEGATGFRLCSVCWLEGWDASAQGREMGQQGAPCCHRFLFQKFLSLRGFESCNKQLFLA